MFSLHEDWTGWLENEGIKVTTFRVRSDFGGGRLFGSREAKTRNMIDGIMTRDQVLDRLAALMVRQRRGPRLRRAESDGIGRLASVLIPGAAVRVVDLELRGKATVPACIGEGKPKDLTEDEVAKVARQAQADRDYLNATVAATARQTV